jgi:hypothetical protein
VRWATSIEKVLRMMKEPTNSATPAKTSRKTLMNDRPSSSAAVWSSACCAAVFTS